MTMSMSGGLAMELLETDDKLSSSGLQVFVHLSHEAAP